VRRKAVILGFYISAALVNAALAIQYAVGGLFGKVALALLAVHFIFQILHGYYDGTISKKYSVGLGVLSCVALVVADFLASLVVRAFAKLYLVYISLSRNHLDNTAVWPIQWYVISVITIVLIFGSSLFKLLHWYGAVELIFAGYAIRSVFFLYIGYYKAITLVEGIDEVDKIGVE
jgi:hypothetical protein